ncbi:MAG: hypothetical protein HY730_09105 [Candidatus Tectomicrobia bacterium]|uniref:Uncharacterized protein n=1 Tax=Tectimicrobiota bacterium TaxID=2528274 RepID=A0A933GPK6_UNCTE|nr:hypothetical protein [Candidatus Tectomicrobia bacterium]
MNKHNHQNVKSDIDKGLEKLVDTVLGTSEKPPYTDAYIASFCNDGGDRLASGVLTVKMAAMLLDLTERNWIPY